MKELIMYIIDQKKKRVAILMGERLIHHIGIVNVNGPVSPNASKRANAAGPAAAAAPKRAIAAPAVRTTSPTKPKAPPIKFTDTTPAVTNADTKASNSPDITT